eukprot:9720012-Alexandrium_andersonii.AAC.1
MSASLVGSEMCIRDRCIACGWSSRTRRWPPVDTPWHCRSYLGGCRMWAPTVLQYSLTAATPLLRWRV